MSEKKNKAPAAILRAFVKYMVRKNAEKEEAKIGLYGDDLEFAVQCKDLEEEDLDSKPTKDLDLRVYPDIVEYCEKIVMVICFQY